MNLYVEPAPLQKVAGETPLDSSSDVWPEQVHQELIRQHPYLGTYTVTPVMTRTDGEQGYGLGFLRVSNRSQMQDTGPAAESLMAARGVRAVRVPIVIRHSKLQPLDIFIDDKGKTWPLTDLRVRAALFRPELFDSTGTAPASAGLAEQLYPPGARMEHSGLIGKYSSEQAMLARVAPTISAASLHKLATELRQETVYQAVAGRPVAGLIDVLANVQPVTREDIAKVAGMTPRAPDVVQVERMGETYLIKTANSEDFAPEVVEADRFTAQEVAGNDLVTEADASGVATVSANPTVRQGSMEDEKISPISDFGEYRVKTTEGHELLGWVFPHVIDFNGVELPMTLFTNGSVSAVQSTIVGSLVGRSTNVIRGRPEGYGFFYRVTSTGGAVAVQPVELRERFEDERGVVLRGTTLLGEPLELRFSPDVQLPTAIDEGVYLLPADVRWAPLGKRVETGLLDNPEAFAKLASLQRAPAHLRVTSDGRAWSLSGPAVEKVAHRWREALGPGDALFMTGVVGMTPSHGARMLVKAAREGRVDVYGCRAPTPAGSRLAAARGDMEKWAAQVPPAPWLLKEAAALEDVEVADKVLSLGFLNPSNVHLFVSWLPELEEALSKLAGLLLAVRLGLDDVSEHAVKTAMTSVDETLVGLKKLVFHQPAA